MSDLIQIDLSNPLHNNSYYQDSDFCAYLFENFQKIINNNLYGFFHYSPASDIDQCYELLKHHTDKKNLVVIGIGGSSLGPEMLCKALSTSNRKVIFLNNIDSEEISSQLSNLDLKETLFYVVSKSGSTAETMAGFIIVTNLLIKQQIDASKWRHQFIFCTDPSTSQLKELAKTYSITCLEIPSNIGGRFSVQTPVGLFPAAFCEIDLNAFQNGLNIIKQHIIEKNKDSHLIKLACEIINQLNLGKDETVIMPYSSKLRELAFWFVQLWAESLGKNNLGLTPIPSYGATDQHSQMQLFMQGPNNKLIIFIQIQNPHTDFELTNHFEVESCQKLKTYSLNQLMQAELEGTLKALREENRNYVNIKIKHLDASSLAQLILLFESLTVMIGIHLKIDPFNQPGVEAGKIYAYEWLKILSKNAE
jgi:glucose-6-phosphate isomerase